MRIGLTFIIAMVAWLVLSGKFDGFHLTLGVLSSALVAIASHDLLLQHNRSVAARGIEIISGLIYFGWLFREILIANIYVFKLAMRPNCQGRLDPSIIRFKTRLRSDFAKFIFANSITLTPGTVTIRIDDDEFIVHSITPELGDDLPGEMENRIARVFDKDPS